MKSIQNNNEALTNELDSISTANKLAKRKNDYEAATTDFEERKRILEEKKKNASSWFVRHLIIFQMLIGLSWRRKYIQIRHYSYIKMINRKKEFTASMTGNNLKSKLGMMAVRTIFLAIMAIIVIFPFYWMISIAFRTPTEINEAATGQMSLWPQSWSTEAFDILFKGRTDLNITTAIFISFGVSITSVITQTSVSLLGGYGVAHFKTRSSEFFVMILLATMMLPGEALLVGQYLIATKLDMKETFLALFIPFIGNAFSLFLFKNAFDGITDSIKQAAKIDGVSNWKFFWKVAIPLVKPIIFTSVLMSFITSWNSILWPQMVIMENKKLYTIPLILWDIMNATGDPQSAWSITLPDGGKLMDPQNLKMAASLVAIAPMFILFVVSKKYLIRGITKQSGAKG
ncbi:sn-glycerol-3-phosphate ABC transporter permease [Williamsoniiplasma luminosum]|uniref:sn-glycerol-3-phosphate ABC transporter permease n=1 Tax=Williamsoniiplasma luminosum TaxID=214888 RepID=A0A2K8NT36_9MOLU|nr:carbohydrate ABC transporter permease [Williamsoniiplasma luminosum]ATZ16924.1 sn-glycerol-3-phosphate ABC transporter permease [Williamsoniiplasma luminosum]